MGCACVTKLKLAKRAETSACAGARKGPRRGPFAFRSDWETEQLQGASIDAIAARVRCQDEQSMGDSCHEL